MIIPPDDMPIKQLPLSPRVHRLLLRHWLSFKTVGDIRQATGAELRRASGIGDTAMAEIARVISPERAKSDWRQHRRTAGAAGA